MEYITLPGTSLRVSRICLGTMQFSNSWEWPCDQATATATVQVSQAHTHLAAPTALEAA
jgi:aryl-alcohol dehydrogenase-like predicted oxidoreductase